MYGNNEKTELKESSYFVAGINQNVTINAEFRSPKKDGSGDPKLCIDILGQHGEKNTVLESPAQDETKAVNQIKRLRRWVKEITGADTFPTAFASYEEMVKQFCETVNGKNTLLEVKLVYQEGSDKYLEMPKYDGCVRAMSNPTRLQLSPAETLRCTPHKAVPSTDDDLAAGAPTDDLPF